MSAPNPFPSKSKGLNAKPAPQVLSNAVKMPFDLQILSNAGKSGNSMVMEPGASSHTNLVLGDILSAKSCGFIAS